MSARTIATSIGKLVNKSSKLLGKLQIGVNKILWGQANTQPIQTVKYDAASSSFRYSTTTPPNPQPPSGNLVNSGLFNALDALNSVDLCNVLTYATDQINIKKKPRPPKPWTAAQTALYAIQDQAALVQNFIDKYTAYPNVFIGSYLGVGPNAVPPEQAVSQSNAPTEGGTEAQKYNMFFLMQAIKEAFTFGGPNSLLTAEDATLLSTVPGLGGNLNIVDDFIGTINKYSDYRQIPNEDLQKIINKINTIRSVCVTIQNLDFKNALALVGNFLNVDIRAQIQKLGAFIDVTKIIPTLKQINSSLRSFIKIAQQVQGILSLGQFIIKLALLFYKVFKFVINFFSLIVIPMIFSTVGAQTNVQDLKDKAKAETDGVQRLLKAINGLLSVVVSFIRYLLANTNELLVRLDLLLVQLEGCQAVKDSEVILELKQTREDLVTLREQLGTYIANYDSKTNPDTATFGEYDIRVVDEELVEQGIVNRRRRGIALNQRGNIVAQSDLTFATNTTVIIEEVKQKLITLGLVQSGLRQADSATLALISDSLNYLDTDDVLQNDLNIEPPQLDSPDNLDENQGLGLNAFVNNLKGGKRLRKRTRTAVESQAQTFKSQVSAEKVNSDKVLNTSGIVDSVGTGSDSDENSATKKGTLTAQQRKAALEYIRTGNEAQRRYAEQKLKQDEKAGGPGRSANPATGL